MKKTYAHQIKAVAPGSIGEELELEPGDRLLEINGQPVEDVLDYRFYIQNEEITLLVEKKDGSQVEWEFDKDYYEDLGIEFENGLMSEYRSCSNRCIFCFIDQMPPGMRKTLYFKDDDARLSFLQGNYVTLTNMKRKDLERIIRYHLSPINISVQTTNPQLRCMMLHNRFAGDIMEKMRMLKDAGIEMNGQIVLCRGVNDREELQRSLDDLVTLYPQLESVSVVPVGLSRFRDGLYPLEPFDRESAAYAVDQIEAVQKTMYDRYGVHFVHASDELYLLAERELPGEECYDGYVQLENGVGMLRLLMEETSYTLNELQGDERVLVQSVATGKLAYPYICRIAEQVKRKFPNVHTTVYPITNYFFGERITVSGLITGTDLKQQLTGKSLGERLLLPANMFRSGEEVFLDDMTRGQLENALQVPVNIVKSDGQDLIYALIGEEREESGQLHSPYELNETEEQNE